MGDEMTVKEQLKLIASVYKPIPSRHVTLYATLIEKATVALKRFSVSGHTFIPGELVQVAENLRNGRIKAYWSPGVGRAAASYHPGGVFFFLPRAILGDTRMVWASAIIHEAVHCAADLRGQKRPYTISGFVDEATAHIAQALFLIHYKKPVTDLQDDDPVLKAAYPIAQSIADNKTSSVKVSQLSSQLRDIGYKDGPHVMNGLGR